MDIRTTFDKITSKTSVYAAAGAGDLAAEKLRAATGRLRQVDGTQLRDQARAGLGALQGGVGSLPGYAATTVNGLGQEAHDVYDDLVGRGRSIIRRVRRQRATEELREQAGTTAARARATRRTAQDAATSTATSTKRTARSTRRSAGQGTRSTTRAGKSTVAAAAKTTKATAKASRDAAKKVG